MPEKEQFAVAVAGSRATLQLTASLIDPGAPGPKATAAKCCRVQHYMQIFVRFICKSHIKNQHTHILGPPSSDGADATVVVVNPS